MRSLIAASSPSPRARGSRRARTCAPRAPPQTFISSRRRSTNVKQCPAAAGRGGGGRSARQLVGLLVHPGSHQEPPAGLQHPVALRQPCLRAPRRQPAPAPRCRAAGGAGGGAPPCPACARPIRGTRRGRRSCPRTEGSARQPPSCPRRVSTGRGEAAAPANLVARGCRPGTT